MLKKKKSSARAVLGDKKYNEIASKTGLPGGQGHKLYEEIRDLNAKRPTVANAKKIESLKSQSINYYKTFFLNKILYIVYMSDLTNLIERLIASQSFPFRK